MITNTVSNLQWYVVYTKPRWEKKVYQLVMDKGIEAYCPLQKSLRQWSDRKKIVLQPLFTSYVFVHILEQQQLEVRQTPGVLNFVYWLGKPAWVREEEILLIKKFLNEYEHVRAEAVSFYPHQQVRITAGLFLDAKAEILSVGNNKVKVRLDSLGYHLVAELKKENIAPLKCEVF